MFGKNRGMLLESIINKTIGFYREHGFAIIHKKEVPIKFASVSQNGRSLVAENSYIVSKSTTDYYGVYKGRFLAFEAKSTRLNALPAKNIKDHQINYLLDVYKQQGIAFFIIFYSSVDQFFLLDIKKVVRLNGHGVTLEYAKKHGTSLELIYPGIIDFLATIDNS